MKKTILIASLIFPERVDWFLNFLEKKFNINKEKVFCYKNLDDESKVIMTFKLVISKDKPMNIKLYFPNAIPIHKKGNSLYTINALNKIIEMDFPNQKGNIDYKNVKVNWSNHQNKLYLTKGKELSVSNISRIF